MTFYNSDNEVVTQLGGGDSAAIGLRINLDSSTGEGARVTSAQVNDLGFSFYSSGNYLSTGFNAQLTGASNTGIGLNINHDGSGGDGIYIDVSNGADGISIYNYDAGDSINITNTDDASKALDILYSGQTDAIYVDCDDASSSGYAIHTSVAGGGAALFESSGAG